MEDLATDRIYRLMLAQRLRHADTVEIEGDDGSPVRHDAALLSRVFDEELAQLLGARATLRDAGDERTFRAAREASEAMILEGWFDPV